MGHKPLLGRILPIIFTLALTALIVATLGWTHFGVVSQATLFNSPISPCRHPLLSCPHLRRCPALPELPKQPWPISLLGKAFLQTPCASWPITP